MKQKTRFFLESILLSAALLFSACDAVQGGGQAASAPGVPSLSAAQDAVNANLRYIDYATAQDIYLSSRPEANHLTPEDDSYIPSAAGLGIAFPVGDSLFLLRTGEKRAVPAFLPCISDRCGGRPACVPQYHRHQRGRYYLAVA